MSIDEDPAAARDRAFVRRALDLARLGWGQTAPNPMVGAVVVRDGVVVGEGHHARYGGAHAEPVALAAAGSRARGATLYVSLEPCAHRGKTPPCADAILAAGIARVVIATAEPSAAAGGGAELLRAAGVDVHIGIEQDAARELNAPFFFAQRALRPWITLKLAVSLDGAITDAARSPASLTGPEARAEVHRMRANCDAIAVGVGTVRVDDPLLTVRGTPPPRVAPRRVIFDARLETPPQSKVLRGDGKGGAPVVVASRGSAVADGGRRKALEAAGAEVLVAASLGEALGMLRARGVRAILAEGGAGLAGSLLEAAAVDRLVIFQAPIVLGHGAVNAFARAPASQVATTARLPIIERRTLGDDLMTVYALTEL